MIEFNVSADLADVQRVIDHIKASGLTDAIINIIGQRSVIDACSVPRKRLCQIAKIIDAMIDDKKLGLSKKELIELLVSEDNGLNVSSASAYISSASGSGVIERTIHGYILSAEAKKELIDGE